MKPSELIISRAAPKIERLVSLLANGGTPDQRTQLKLILVLQELLTFLDEEEERRKGAEG